MSDKRSQRQAGSLDASVLLGEGLEGIQQRNGRQFVRADNFVFVAHQPVIRSCDGLQQRVFRVEDSAGFVDRVVIVMNRDRDPLLLRSWT